MNAVTGGFDIDHKLPLFLQEVAPLSYIVESVMRIRSFPCRDRPSHI